MFNTAGSFDNFSQFFVNCFTLPIKGGLWRFLQGKDVLLNDVALDLLVLTGLVLGIQKKEDFWLTSFVAQSVVVLTIAKEIALPPTYILLGEEGPSKALMIVAIIDGIICLFSINDVAKLPELLF